MQRSGPVLAEVTADIAHTQPRLLSRRYAWVKLYITVAALYRWPYCAGDLIAQVNCAGGHIAQVAVLRRWPYCTCGRIAQVAILRRWPYFMRKQAPGRAVCKVLGALPPYQPLLHHHAPGPPVHTTRIVSCRAMPWYVTVFNVWQHCPKSCGACVALTTQS